jgi:short-subunit dehydrogenase involved in D-alanine esterification of teichoic acids
VALAGPSLRRYDCSISWTINTPHTNKSTQLVETGTSVIVSGRREENLKKFVEQYSSNSNVTVDHAVFDITNHSAIPSFAADIFAKHPDIDCVWMNSGLQRSMNWAEPETIDLDKMDLEINTNYSSVLRLTKAFLPFLQKQAPKETSIIYTTSGLALVPILHCPNYCATKAALHHTILAMRQQLKDAGSNVKIIELYPPAVQTELHDAEMGDKGKSVGMPLADFTEEAFAGLCKEDNEQVPVQMVKTFMGFNGWEQERQKTFQKMVEAMKSSGH